VGALLLLESPRAGRTVQSRLVGALRGIQEKLGPLPEKAIHHLDGGGDKATSKAVVTAFFKSRPRKRILIVGINDESAIGAVEAVDEIKAGTEVAIVGHGGSTEIRSAIVIPKSPCIGTISFHAELYGADLLHFALPLAQGRPASAAHYVPHEFLGREALMREHGGKQLLRLSS
jgi:ribose transport system substrate-binding protein